MEPSQRAYKSLGQHWLQDTVTLNSICDFAEVQQNDIVLEIGPGLGTLTQVLINRGATVYAVEFDERLARELPQRVPSAHLTIEHADILQFNLSNLPAGYKVVANIPYNITSHIVRRLLETANPPKSTTLLVQKEVAERIAALPGNMSLMSVAAQFYADITLGQIVPAKLFTPPPKVDSQIIRLDYTGPKFTDIDPKDFFRIVKAGFAERRKKLRSSLAGGLHLSKDEVDRLLQKVAIDPDTRAQELRVNQWYDILVHSPHVNK